MREETDAARAPSAEPRARLLGLTRGYRISQAIYVLARLGIPDLLADGPRDSDDLANATRSHPASLHRVLRFLAGIGVLDAVGPRRFALSAMGDALRTDAPGSMRPTVLLLLDESHWRPWGHLLHTVRTGETAFDHAHGAGLFDYLAGHAEVATLFNAGMGGTSPAHARLVAAAYDFSAMRLVVDVGGGRGRLLAAILERNPALRGILFDMPHVIAEARPIVEASGVADRCELVGGSFFEAVPSGADAYVLRGIVPGFDDDRAVGILASCRRAMRADARLL